MKYTLSFPTMTYPSTVAICLDGNVDAHDVSTVRKILKKNKYPNH